MANEAAVTMVLRMRDEASAQMKQFGQTTEQAQIQAIQFNAALTAMGSALTAVGSLIGKIDSPLANLASNFLLTGGAILTTTSAIVQMIPYIGQLINWLRNLAIAQALVRALAGPVGWAQLGAGLAIAGAVAGGIYAMTGGQSNQMVTPYAREVIKIEGGPLLMSDDAAMDRFARKITERQRNEAAKGR